jgi:hypothetical protein
VIGWGIEGPTLRPSRQTRLQGDGTHCFSTQGCDTSATILCENTSTNSVLFKSSTLPSNNHTCTVELAISFAALDHRQPSSTRRRRCTDRVWAQTRAFKAFFLWHALPGRHSRGWMHALACTG